MRNPRLYVSIVIAAIFSSGYNIHQLLELSSSSSSSAEYVSSTESSSDEGFEIPTPRTPVAECAQKHSSNVLYNQFPVMSSDKLASVSSPLSVGLVTSKRSAKLTTKHILVDGIEQSEYLNLTVLCALLSSTADQVCNTSVDVDLWIIDLVLLMADQTGFDKHPLVQELLSSPQSRRKRSYKVMIVDYRDQPGRKVYEKQLDLPFPNADTNSSNPSADINHLRIAIGSIIQGRWYDNDNGVIHLGESMLEPRLEVGGGPLLHSPYTVRSDVLQAMEQVLLEENSIINHSKTNSITQRTITPICKAIYMDRPMDVIHLWDPNVGTIMQRHAARYRDAVSHKIQEINGQTYYNTATNTTSTLRSSVKLQGPIGRPGRRNANLDYARALLNSKIVIATQRDKWEDHYRLMEALSSGAMVISDEMLSLPRGFYNGTNIVMFDSVERLEGLVRYFLEHENERFAIAKKGVETALGWHRSWHRMEGLLFGCPLTNVGNIVC